MNNIVTNELNIFFMKWKTNSLWLSFSVSGVLFSRNCLLGHERPEQMGDFRLNTLKNHSFLSICAAALTLLSFKRINLYCSLSKNQY